MAGFLVLSENLCNWFLGDGYAEVPLLLKIMSLRFFFSGFSSILSEQLFIIMGKEKYMTIATLISALINVALNFLLIPKIGAIGASITTTFSEVVVLFILLFLSFKNKLLSLKEIISPSWRYLISSLIMFGIISIIQSYMNYSILNFLLITFIGSIIYFTILLCLKEKIVTNCILSFTILIKRLLKKTK